jgi:hypothetical protein
LGDATLAGQLRTRGSARAAVFTWERTARVTLAAYQYAAHRGAAREK